MAASISAGHGLFDRIPERLRLSPRSYSIITRVSLVLVAAIIVTGAGVRLTQSGLGCPQWPQCTADRLVPRAAAGSGAAIEFANRAITGLVSVAVIVAVLGALARAPRRRDLTYLALGLVGGIVAQIVLGGVTVLTHLNPVSVGAHFLLSQIIVWNAVVLVWRAGTPPGPRRPVVGPAIRNLATALVPLLALVMVLGVGLTGTGPHSGDAMAHRFTFDTPTVARFHGIVVETFTAVVATMLILAWRQRAPRDVLRRGSVVLLAAIAQSVVGYTQYFTGIPAVLVGVHVLFATVLWISVLRFHLGLREAVAPAESADLARVGSLLTSR